MFHGLDGVGFISLFVCSIILENCGRGCAVVEIFLCIYVMHNKFVMFLVTWIAYVL